MDMRSLRPIVILNCVTLLAGASLQCLGADGAPRRNPFAKPSLTPELTGPATQTTQVPTVAWRPRLSAIVAAGGRSMVLVDSVVVEIGQEIDGYRLLSVAEDKAVFAKGRQRVELTMNGEKGLAP